MIYLSRHRLLFLKPKKTAGTSVEIAFSCNAMEGDIVTPVLPEDERKRHEMGGRFPQNWAWRAPDEALYRERFEKYLRDGVIAPRWFGLRRGRLYLRRDAKFINHITPRDIERRAGRAFLHDSFVVTMCRHPYETMVSWASHLHADNGGSLDRLLDMASRHRPLNEVYLFDERKPDFVIRYEHLKDDLAELERRFGLSLIPNLPVTKGTARSDRRKAADILNEAQKARIRESHRRTFDAFGYQP